MVRFVFYSIKLFVAKTRRTQNKRVHKKCCKDTIFFLYHKNKHGCLLIILVFPQKISIFAEIIDFTLKKHQLRITPHAFHIDSRSMQCREP